MSKPASITFSLLTAYYRSPNATRHRLHEKAMTSKLSNAAWVKIRPKHGWSGVNFRELIAYHDLIGFLIWRDIKSRHRQTALGALWVVVKPLLAMLIITIVFGRFIGIPSDGISYPIFCLAGLVLWGFFTQALTNASESIVANSALVEKVYFPRLVLPIAAAVAALLDFLISLAVLVVITTMAGHPLGLRFLI